MKDHTLQELIEGYLLDNLSAADRQAVELRMQEDPGFRAELEFQRALHESLADPGALRLRRALDEIVHPAAAPPPSGRRSRWLNLAALALLTAVALYLAWLRWGSASPEPGPNTPTPEPLQQNELPPAAEPADTTPPPARDWQKQPIAMANPADFAPNPDLEARIGGIRGGGQEFELNSPAPDAKFLRKNGRVVLPVEAVWNADSLAAGQPLRLFVYSNRQVAWANKKPVQEWPLSLESADSAGRYRITALREIPLRPGLYYLVVGQARPEDGGGYRTVWVSRFLVVSR